MLRRIQVLSTRAELRSITSLPRLRLLSASAHEAWRSTSGSGSARSCQSHSVRPRASLIHRSNFPCSPVSVLVQSRQCVCMPTITHCLCIKEFQCPTGGDVVRMCVL
ncbi:hypothetical protein BD310DRAFT_911333 [Dichomitus squalens]|uniref:Uncharacterized protein n=1 Tax=Dichomitus squalens TaxID=114155 RepID=A0A4Q9QCF0_9APHY|nr:hypothetical protein BD310DRAFT_911333 [Dichomitus squalens]